MKRSREDEPLETVAGGDAQSEGDSMTCCVSDIVTSAPAAPADLALDGQAGADHAPTAQADQSSGAATEENVIAAAIEPAAASEGQTDSDKQGDTESNAQAPADSETGIEAGAGADVDAASGDRSESTAETTPITNEELADLLSKREAARMGDFARSNSISAHLEKRGVQATDKRKADDVPGTWTTLDGRTGVTIGPDYFAVSPAAGPAAIAPFVRACCNAAMKAFSKAGSLSDVWRVHETALALEIPADITCINLLVNACGAVGDVEKALTVIDEAYKCGLKPFAHVEVVTSLLHACAIGKRSDKAVEVYERAMNAGLIPNRALLNALSFAHAKNGDIAQAVAAYERGCVVHSDCAFGRWRVKRRNRRAMQRRAMQQQLDERAAVVALLRACIEAKQPRRAFELFNRLVAQGQAVGCSGSYTHLLFAAAASGMVHEGQAIFKTICESGLKLDNKMVNSMIVGHASQRDATAAFTAWEVGFSLGVLPDINTVHCLLRACCSARPYERDRRLLVEAERLVQDNGFDMSSEKSSHLLLKAHLACIRAGDPRGKSGLSKAYPVSLELIKTRLAIVLRLFDDGAERGVQWDFRTRHWLLHVCAEEGRLAPAMLLLDEMESRHERAAFFVLDKLVHLHHTSGLIDSATLELWVNGGVPMPFGKSNRNGESNTAQFEDVFEDRQGLSDHSEF
mmetsp:Transcript_24348/g.40271  ORF Transcript_24348/g.40271 Transcript_24348/m.40271 type:complete len:686 (-) Transcript_24348:223-2280(-)